MIKSHVVALDENVSFEEIFKEIYRSKALITPSFSIGSFVVRRPAVSQITTGYPPRSIVDSIKSRVVPAMGETIAVGRCAEQKQNDRCQ